MDLTDTTTWAWTIILMMVITVVIWKMSLPSDFFTWKMKLGVNLVMIPIVFGIIGIMSDR